MKVLAMTIVALLTLTGSEEPCPLTKREYKELANLFGDNFRIGLLPFNGETPLETDLFRQNDCLHVVSQDGEVTGYLLSTSAKGRFDFFDYSIIYSNELIVLQVMVTVYRSDHGAGICQKKWLEQFRGYQGGEMAIGREIDAVSGGTISSASMVEDIQRCQHLMVRLKEAGLISSQIPVSSTP